MNRIFAVVQDLCAKSVKKLRGRYVVMLEGEVARLRAENHDLLNSVLGARGLPPLDPVLAQKRRLPSVRRRSWPQIARAHEVESWRNVLGVRHRVSAEQEKESSE